jgi:anthranilate synthase component 1
VDAPAETPATPGWKTAPPSAALGELDTCIAIRTLWLRDGVAHLQAGGGIVADSDPAAEHEECLAKLRALEAAIDLAESEQDAAP